jgi:hypothetical protein
MKKNFNNYLNDLLSDIQLPSEDVIKADTKAEKISLRLKGIKHSEEIKKKWSEAHTGKKLSQEHIEKVKTKGKQTKWLQLLEKYPLQSLLDAQSKHGNHQRNTCNELGISFYSYKKLCKNYGLDLKKSNYEKTEFARTKQSEPILVWQCSKREPFIPIGKPKEYYSVSECCRSFEPKLHKGNMLRNMNNETPYRNMFFKKK